MNLAQYIPLAIRTAKSLPKGEQLDHAWIGMVTEVGELADAIKRAVIYGKDFDITNLEEEVGDIAWYVALHIDTCEMALENFPASTRMYSSMSDIGLTKEMISLIDVIGRRPHVSQGPTWYLLQALKQFLENKGLSFERAFEKNIAKLSARYGDKYSDYRALNRDLGAERAVLEAK